MGVYLFWDYVCMVMNSVVDKDISSADIFCLYFSCSRIIATMGFLNPAAMASLIHGDLLSLVLLF